MRHNASMRRRMACKGRRCRVVGPPDRVGALRALVRPREVVRRLGPVEGLCADMIADFMADNLTYIADGAEADVWCSPQATLHKGGGDCDDLSIFACAMARAAGCIADVKVGYLFEAEEGWIGHAWVEGVDRHGPFLLEATAGVVYRDRPAEYVPVP